MNYQIMVRFISLFAGYLAGSFLTAAIVCRVYTGRSVWETGTGNPGMANIMAHIGKKAGFTVLIGDILKVIITMLLCALILPKEYRSIVLWWTGFGSIIGHNDPLWHKFRGGKGVTVTCTWLIIVMPVWGTLACIAGGIITLVSGYLPLGAVLITLFAIPVSYLTLGIEAGILVTLAAIIMIIRHFNGIKRVFTGKEEKKFRGSSSVRGK